MSNSNSWLDEIGTLNQIKTTVMERSKIYLSRYQHEQSIAARIRKTIYQHSSECDIYKSDQDLFYAVNG